MRFAIMMLCLTTCTAGDEMPLGTLECRTTADGCEEGCHSVSGERLDREANCRRWVDRILCSHAPGGGGGGCFTKAATSEVYLVGGENLTEPAFLGWRACTEFEQVTVQSAPPCI